MAGDQPHTARLRFAILDPDGVEIGTRANETIFAVRVRTQGKDAIEFGYKFPPFPVARPGAYTVAYYVNAEYQKDIALYVYAGLRPAPIYERKTATGLEGR